MSFLDKINEEGFKSNDVMDMVKAYWEVIKGFVVDIALKIYHFITHLPVWAQVLLVSLFSCIIGVAVWYLWKNRDQIPPLYRY